MNTTDDFVPRFGPSDVPEPISRINPPNEAVEVRLENFDFIDDYVRYADVLEVPPEAHEAIAVLLLAGAMNGNVYFDHGNKIVNFDLWVLLLSESSMGRNYVVEDIATPVLENAGLDRLIHKQIAAQPVGLFIWPELSIILKKFQDSRFSGIQQWVTDIRDGNKIPAAVTYRVTGKRSDTPPIVFTTAPRLNILSTSSADWFYSSLAREDSTGGFLPRWTIMLLPKTDRCIPIPRKTDPSLLAPLAEHLRRVSELKGQADLSDCIDVYEKWYGEAQKRFKNCSNPALAEPFFRRLRTQVLQFAVIYHVSERVDLQIGRHATERAIQMATKLEQTIFQMLQTGMTQEGSEVDRMSELIRSRRAAGASSTDITRAFKHWRPRDRKDRLQTLLESESIELFYRKTKGRHAKIYVAAEFHEEHAKLYPEDMPEPPSENK